jgi:DNA invertase Pin-like site-specific DNA recombinase
MAEFIAYYRVSTDRQGASGLGLAAQRAAMARFIGAGQLVAEYTEVESGKQHSNRPQLLAALADCRTRRAVLLIARLDRLARNVAFIAKPDGERRGFRRRGYAAGHAPDDSHPGGGRGA